MDEELGDQQWEQIAPLLPQHQRRGRPRADDRRTIEGIPSASSGQVCGCSGPVAAGRTYQQGMAGQPVYLPPQAKGVAGPGSVGTDTAEVSQHPGPPGQTGLEPGFSGWPRLHRGARQKGGQDIAYGWKGKGSTVHLVTEGNGLPLAFLVTAANVSEVTVGLEVLDRVKVPRPQGRPRQRRSRFYRGFAGEGFSRPFQGGSGKAAAADQADLPWCIQSAGVAGR